MVNDGSGSMTLPFDKPDESIEGASASETKAAAVETAVKTLLEEMQKGRGPANFHFSFISFNNAVTEERAPQPLPAVSAQASYDPTRNGIGGTAIHRGLDAAAAVVEKFMAEHAASELPLSAVVTVMSDGEERDDVEMTRKSAARIREMRNTDVAACLFATKDQPAPGGELLDKIVSRPSLYKCVYNARELRGFFSESITKTRPGLPRGDE
jgi:hypothetical protein